MGGYFELRKDEDTGRRYWWGAEDGWKDATEVGESGTLTLSAEHFKVGTVLQLSEPDDEAMMIKPRCTLCGAAATRTLGNRPVCAFCYQNGPLEDYPQEVVIGTCDDCGAEGVRIWRTEFNWQCQTCKAQNDDEDDQP